MSQRLPTDFLHLVRDVMPESEWEHFVASLDGRSLVSVRFNPFKLREKPQGSQVPWSHYGFYLDERPQFTLDPLFHGGLYYVQEASSMFVEHLYRAAVGDAVGVRLLDLCAAPGGKTTLYATVVGLEGMVVANEVIRSRANVLADNVRRWGLGNVAVTSNDPAHFTEIRDWFDVVAIDAPCSGEGMFRKEPDARAEWSLANVELCAARQRRIVSDAWNALKPGGVLIYSTCTYNRAENEDNVRWMLEEFDCEGVAADVPESWGIARSRVECEGREAECYRFYPHRVKGEGFFVTMLRKGGDRVRTRLPKPRKQPFSKVENGVQKELSEWVVQPEFTCYGAIGDSFYGYYSSVFEDLKLLAEVLTVIYSGVQLGQVYHGKLKPAHSLAMFHDLNLSAVRCAELELDAARDYLRKRDIDAGLLAEGTNLITFSGVPLGWAKRIGARVNNQYPNELRIANL